MAVEPEPADDRKTTDREDDQSRADLRNCLGRQSEYANEGGDRRDESQGGKHRKSYPAPEIAIATSPIANGKK